jgi:myo-inositol 2-dehydrogenase / D-chiro-inositol 1-dehydrogenase
MKQVLLCGAGKIAGKHVKCIANIQNAVITGICDIRMDAAKVFAESRNLFVPIYGKIQEALDHGTYDYCILSTPRLVRLPIIEACAKACVPVLIEKPPCDTLATGKKAEAVLQGSNLLHSVGFMHRWNESLNKTLDAISGERKMLVMIQFYNTFYHQLDRLSEDYFDPFNVSISGGVVGDQCIHYLDLVRYISGCEVRKIQTVFAGNQGIPIRSSNTTVDTLTWTLEMENGIIVSHTHTWCAPFPKCSVEIMTDKSSITVDLFKNKASGQVAGGPFEYQGTTDEYEEEHRGFLRAIEAKDQSMVRSSYTDALKTFALTEEMLSLVQNTRNLKMLIKD